MYLRSIQKLYKLRNLITDPRHRVLLLYGNYVTTTVETLDRQLLYKNYYTCGTNYLNSLERNILSARRAITQVANDAADEDTKTSHTDSFEYIMNRILKYYQHNGVINHDQLQPLIAFLQDRTASFAPTSPSEFCLTPEQSIFILQSCSCEMPSLTSVERMNNFQQIWQALKQNNQITKDHFHTMLQAFKYNRIPLENYSLLLKEYENLGGVMEDIYPRLLAVAGAGGNVQLATELLAHMRSLESFKISEDDFEPLLWAYGRSKDLQGVETVCTNMLAANFQLNAEIQSTLAAIYLENNREDKANQILNEHRHQFDTSHILKILNSLTNLTDYVPRNIIQDLIRELPNKYLDADEVPVALRRISLELLYSKKLDVVKEIINALPKPTFKDGQNIDTYGVFLMEALFRANYPIQDIIDIGVQLEESGKNSRALWIIGEFAAQRNPPVTLQIFEVLQQRGQKLRPHYFWPLLMYNFRRHNESGILRTLKIMNNFQVPCDALTIKNYVLPRLSIILEKPRMALKQLDEVGVKTHLVLTPILNHLLFQHKWLETISIVNDYESKIQVDQLINPLCAVGVHIQATKKYRKFATLLSALSKRKPDNKMDFIGQLLCELFRVNSRLCRNLNYCQRLFERLREMDLRLSPSAARAIKSYITANLDNADSNTTDVNSSPIEDISKNVNAMIDNSLVFQTTESLDLDTEADLPSNTFIKHPREMSYDELECHLVELESKQMNTRAVLRRLLQTCVRYDRLERALEINQKCESLQLHKSPGMLACLVELYVKLKDINKAQRTLEQLQEKFPGFLIDEHKFIDYATLLIENNRLDEAKELLKKRSQTNRIIGGNYTLKNVWQLLTNVAHLAAKQSDLPEEQNLTNEMLRFLQSMGYCRHDNVVLGPIIRERLLRRDVLAAVREFKQLVEEYKHTPLFVELLSLLVRLSNSKKSSSESKSTLENDSNQTNEVSSDQYNCSAEQAQHLLSDVTEVASKVHGIMNTNSALLTAFAESGTDNQIRRLLLNSAFSINEDVILRNCEHLSRDGAIQTLLRLARGFRGIQRTVNEQKIYQILLDNFIKMNDCEGALKLFKHLEADDEMKISQEFARQMVSFLRANNTDIPSILALRAQIEL